MVRVFYIRPGVEAVKLKSRRSMIVGSRVVVSSSFNLELQYNFKTLMRVPYRPQPVFGYTTKIVVREQDVHTN